MKGLYKSLLLLLLTVASTIPILAQQDNKEIKSLIIKNAQKLGITAADAQDAVISSSYTDALTQVTYVYLQQAYQQIPVYNTIITAAFSKGNFLYASGSFVNAIATKAGSAAPSVSYTNAVQAAVSHLQIENLESVSLVSDLFSTAKKYVVTPSGIARRNIEVSLYWTPSDDKQQVTLTWNVNIDEKRSSDWWNVRVNAQTGEFVQKDNWTVNENFGATEAPLKGSAIPVPSYLSVPTKLAGNKQKPIAPSVPPLFLQAPPPAVTGVNYRVVPFPIESPNYGAIATVNNPWLMAGVGNNAITHGWHYDGNTDYKITRGNNVFAFLDVTNSNTSNPTTNWPDTSSTEIPSLNFVNNPVFTQQPISSTNNINKKFALDNLFYWNNIIHDITYQYGFTEAAGNFQADNISRGGAGNDFVSANAMDGGGYNNANFSTPTDGTSGRMQMYLWSGTSFCTINSPATIAGTVPAIEAGFTTTVSNKLINTGPRTGNVVLYNDNVAGTAHTGCVAAANAAAINGNIAMIDAFGATGCTTYSQKVRNAQNAGAIAVIVYSNTSSPLSFGGNDANALALTVPVVSISNAVGVSIVNQLTLGNTVNFTMNSGIYLDGDIDNGIVTHEYGHGVSNRLTGGPFGASCLGNAEQAGEGWSDYLALMLTTNWSAASLTDGANGRPVGTYAYNQSATGTGIRRYPYSTTLAIDPLTYANMATSTEVHNTGEIWCSAVWDMTWNIIQQVGSITPNLYNSAGTGGNVIAMNLVITGMKLQPCSPGFIDGRNAILAADSILYGYAHKCAIWNAFARRGMGFSASQGLSTSAVDQTVAFDLPTGIRLDQQQPIIVSANTQRVFTTTATCDCTPTSFVLRDTIPAGFTYVSSTPAGTLSGNVLTFPSTAFTASEAKNFSVTLQAPATGCTIDSVLNDSREGSPVGGFTSSGTSTWTSSAIRSHTPANSWLAPNIITVSSTSLTSTATTTTAAKPLSILSFWQNFRTETTYDGGVVEYSTDGGNIWNDAAPMFLGNAYNTAMNASTVLAGRKAFSGNSQGFEPVLLNLASLGTTSVQFRFRMETDAGTGVEGWYVDDIIRANGCGGILRSGIYDAAGGRRDTVTVPVFVTPPALPLTLLWFYASPVGSQVALDWKTASEINTKDFTIEWSTNGSTWSSIGSTPALSRSTNSYSFVHKNPATGINYYRIKMNDVDGHFTYSPVRTVNMDKKSKSMIVLVPNPANTDAVLYLSKEAKTRQVKIFDAAGSLVRQLTVGTNVQQLTIATSGLAAGVYTVEAVGESRYTTRMIVQH